MANPTPYSRGYSFSGYQANNPNRPLPGPALDNELENLERTTTETIQALADIRRSDGSLQNGIVTEASLSFDMRALADTATKQAEIATAQAGAAAAQAYIAAGQAAAAAASAAAASEIVWQGIRFSTADLITFFATLPTTPPPLPGIVWNNGGSVQIS